MFYSSRYHQVQVLNSSGLGFLRLVCAAHSTQDHGPVELRFEDILEASGVEMSEI